MLILTGCGVTPKVSDPAASAGVERCGSETRACWQVKSTVDVEEYGPDATTAAGVHPNSIEQASGAH